MARRKAWNFEDKLEDLPTLYVQRTSSMEQIATAVRAALTEHPAVVLRMRQEQTIDTQVVRRG